MRNRLVGGIKSEIKNFAPGRWRWVLLNGEVCIDHGRAKTQAEARERVREAKNRYAQEVENCGGAPIRITDR